VARDIVYIEYITRTRRRKQLLVVRDWKRFAMPNETVKPLPFEVDRGRPTSLTEQVANGLRRAVMTGYYQAGEVLPTLLDMAQLLGVSAIVTRGAIKVLAKEGLVIPRPRVGIVVCEPAARPWQAQVLYLSMSGPAMYYHNMLVGTLSERLLAQRVLFEHMHLSWRERMAGFPKVKTVLGASQIDLAVVEGPAEDAVRMLHDSGVPCVHITGTGQPPSESAAGSVVHDNLSPYGAAAEHALACGVRTVWVLSNARQETLGRAFFGTRGMRVADHVIEPVPDFPSPMCVELAGMNAMVGRLEDRTPLPDLLVFTDDFVGRGALLALSRRGLRIPEDVQVITWANRGLGPVYFKPLTRIESDGAGDGDLIADYLLQFLRHGKMRPKQLCIGAEFIVGETTKGDST
jgi:DNA-binding transcriptional regulator YhcF (GntR family)